MYLRASLSYFLRECVSLILFPSELKSLEIYSAVTLDMVILGAILSIYSLKSP